MGKDELEKKVRMLPKALRDEALDYINFLVAKKEADQSSDKKLSFNWEGGLSELKEKYTSVELQHEANK